jgi:hypothetical protein
MNSQAKAAPLQLIATNANAVERVLAGLKLHRREATAPGKRTAITEQSEPGEVDVLVPRGWAFA